MNTRGDVLASHFYSTLYLGDLARGLMGLIRAEGEFEALTRFDTDPETAASLVDIAETVTLLVDEAKWCQQRLRSVYPQAVAA
jgi:hypothetical protein